jgi:nitroreductase
MGKATVLGTILNRASIRRFQPRPVAEDALRSIVRAGQQAPFTGQMYSVIVVTDRSRREQLRPLFGRLPVEAPVFMLICIDFARLEQFVSMKGRRNRADDLSMLFLGIQDASYFAMNMVLAAEALGLGSVFLGAAPFVATELAAMFGLPERVYPLVGLCVGYPDENPPPRPRIPLEMVYMRDGYRMATDAEARLALEIMDAGLIREGYYARLNAKIPLSEGPDDIGYDTYGWGEHVSRKYGQMKPRNVQELLARQGIKVGGPG